MNYDMLFLVGRILFGGFFVVMGMNHLLKLDDMSKYTASKKVPIPMVATIITGLLLLMGGLGIIFWVYVRLSAWALIIFLVPTAFKMHDFWAAKDSQEKMTQMVNFMKNLAFAGAALIIISLVSFV